jgi:hypothetical protein
MRFFCYPLKIRYLFSFYPKPFFDKKIGFQKKCVPLRRRNAVCWGTLKTLMRTFGYETPTLSGADDGCAG